MKNYFNFTEAERGEKEPRLHKCFPSLLTFPQPQLQPPQQQQQHYHTHQQSNQLNNELSLSFNLIEND